MSTPWKHLFLIACSLATAMATAQEAPSDPNDGVIGAANAGWAVQEAFAGSEYAKADSLIAQYCNTKERLNDGRWQLSGVAPSLEHFFEAYAEWKMMFGKIGEWRRENPNSSAVNVVESMLWRTWAWSARGKGLARTVAPEAWQMFRERLQKAADLLAESRDESGSCAWYYEEWQKVLLGLGSDPEVGAAAFEAGVKQFPDYTPIYNQRMWALMPRWGGSYEEIDRFIDDVTRRNLGSEGEALYTRLYMWIDSWEGLEFELFHDSLAKWPRMKAGFDLLRERYPQSTWIPNSFAAYACRAGDRETYIRIRQRLVRPYYLSAWPENYSIEVCDARLMKTA
jgi:hypothetical protein